MFRMSRINNDNSSDSSYSSALSKSMSSTFQAACEQSSMSREADQMRWLSPPNLRLVSERQSSSLADLKRIRISFDVTGFRQENIQINIENRVLIISGVHEEGSRESGSFDQKQFEKRYELPPNVELDSMVSYIDTEQNQLVVEIPLIRSQKHPTKLSNSTEQRRVCFDIYKPDEQLEQSQQKLLSTHAMTSSTQGSTSNNEKIDILSELLQSGKALMSEKYSELIADSHHLSQLLRPIRQAHDVCLVDTQRQDQESVAATHQLQNTINDSELTNIIIKMTPKSLQNGQMITVQKTSTTTDSNQQQQPSDTFIDLYKDQYSTRSVGTNNIPIEIPKQLIERRQTSLVQKDNSSVTKTADYHKQHPYNLTNMVGVTVQVPPGLLNSGQAITIRREDLQSGATDYHRHQTSDTNQRHLTNNGSWSSGGMMSMQEFMSNKTWNPSMSINGRLLQIRLEFASQPWIVRGDQLKLTLNGYDLRVEATDQQECILYRQMTLPKTAQLTELKCEFDEHRRCLNVSVPY